MSSLRTINTTETGEDSKEDAELEELKTAREEEQAFGERLLDDLMNIFCDKLQRAAQEQKRTIDGLLAIQYITRVHGRRPMFWQWFCCKRLDMNTVRKMISGERRAMQIIFDSERTHYVVLYLNSRRKVIIYDSLHSTDLESMLTESVRQQIQTLFGHLYHGGEVPVQVELSYERQTDDWSCGYRAVACVTSLARAENPVRHQYDLPAIYRLLVAVLDQPISSWETFHSAVISRTPPESRFSKTLRLIQNSWILTASLLSKRGREEENSRVSLLLRQDLSYTVTGGMCLLLKKKCSQTGSMQTESTKTAISSSITSLIEGSISTSGSEGVKEI